MAFIHISPLAPRTTKGQVLHFICTTGGIEGKQVGRIEVQGSTGLFEVDGALGPRLIKALDGAELNGRTVRAWTRSAPATAYSEEDHFQMLVRLLEYEGKAEAEQTRTRIEGLSKSEAERLGDCLIGLVVIDENSGLGGRCLVSLGKRNRSAALPWTKLRVGSPVVVIPENEQGGVERRGVVCERSERVFQVAVAEPLEDSDASYRVVLSNDETSRERQRAILDRVRGAARERLAELRGVLLGEVEPTFNPTKDWGALDSSLNDSQKEAVDVALAAHDLAIIHGPPGTGKTTAVIELIRQAVRRGEKVLACAPSNMAVDNLLERLVARGEKAVRLGHPARVQADLQEHTLDLMVEAHSDMRLSRKLSKEAYALFRKASKFTRAKPEPGARRDLRQEGRSLLNDARKLEAQAVEWILDSATIVCATNTSVDSEVLGQRQFDLAVIDEAAQATEPGCWIPISRAKRVVLAGDHCQLPPTVLSREAEASGFGISLLERLVDRYGPLITRRLKTQYRMHEAIMNFSGLEFYEADLEAHPSVGSRKLCELDGVSKTELTDKPVRFIDTAGAGYDEHVEADGASRFNPEEARVVIRQVQQLMTAGVKATDIAVMAPYSAQVRLLREHLNIPGLEVDSVDGFQGREKEAVIISLVRSNPEGEIGFLGDIRRMNVAMTRARRSLQIVGDSATLACHPFYQRLLTYFEEINAYHTVWEEEV